MFKKIDYIIISFVCFVLAVMGVSQVFSAKNYNKITQPENNAVLAVEVAKLTQSNADLRTEVKSLTENLDKYKNSNSSRQTAYEQYQNELRRYNLINGSRQSSGQGIVLTVDGNLSMPQLIDLINAIKNSGGELIALNNNRLTLNTNLDPYINAGKLEAKILGNSKLLQSALERKGGIIEQIATKDVRFSIEARENIDIPASNKTINFKYSKILIN